MDQRNSTPDDGAACGVGMEKGAGGGPDRPPPLLL
jgi:hypothetical protein